MPIYIYIYIYRERERERDLQCIFPFFQTDIFQTCTAPPPKKKRDTSWLLFDNTQVKN